VLVVPRRGMHGAIEFDICTEATLEPPESQQHCMRPDWWRALEPKSQPKVSCNSAGWGAPNDKPSSP
jgi:hypothetical protein